MENSNKTSNKDPSFLDKHGASLLIVALIGITVLMVLFEVYFH